MSLGRARAMSQLAGEADCSDPCKQGSTSAISLPSASVVLASTRPRRSSEIACSEASFRPRDISVFVFAFFSSFQKVSAWLSEGELAPGEGA
jgi:hypothetical protein